jgi:hypothetical protein
MRHALLNLAGMLSSGRRRWRMEPCFYCMEFAGSMVFGCAHLCFYFDRLVLEGATQSSVLR